jgi:predicted peroxiredoxin
MVGMAEEKRKLVVLISHNANGDKSTVGFTIANAALSGGMDVLVFLVSDGVELGREGASDLAHIRPFRPLGELIDAFVKAGGVVAACGSCLQYRGMTAEHNAPGVQVAGVATLTSWLAAGAAAVSL